MADTGGWGNVRQGHWWQVRVSPGRQAFGFFLLVLAAIFFYLMFGEGMRFFVVDSKSMQPTLHAGDRLVAIPPKSYERGDIIIVRDPLEGNRGYLVKRLIGLPGDTIEIKGGAVFLNGTYLSEPYRPEPIAYPMPTYRVPEKSVFVLGDNSNWSVDSHNDFLNSNVVAPAALPMDKVVARAVFQYFPPGRMGRVHGYPLSGFLAPPPARSEAARALQ